MLAFLRCFLKYCRPSPLLPSLRVLTLGGSRRGAAHRG